VSCVDLPFSTTLKLDNILAHDFNLLADFKDSKLTSVSEDEVRQHSTRRDRDSEGRRARG